jgi:hypothetical protein
MKSEWNHYTLNLEGTKNLEGKSFVRGKEGREWAKRKEGLHNLTLHLRGGRTPFIHDR